ncbi:hypothetical protein QMK33_20075 [Hymenobacter sp. H14-R3]|uniref:hypothetical protein n=1 Tax=Hymenobacter sp. H14-R3 TaxID=3046308 RepID=UPI0024BB4A85|nr:hypothetical protein [Hymenobacter sp. H14-R3]MDJ0367453.1 hypothetical protein [Hymenobacter sp. H14-R3]
MLKQLLLATLLCLGFAPAWAQNPVTDESLASQQFKQRLRSQYLTNDTAQAIITLYGKRQVGGVGWVVGALLSAVRIGTASNTTTNYGGYGAQQQDTGSNMGAAFLIATPLVAYGVGKVMHYSNAHLNGVLTAYAAGQPLPHALRRKLRPRFFKEPIVRYKEVKYKPAN